MQWQNTDQKDISKQYKGLKKLLKLIKEVDEKLGKSQNHKALATLDEALSGMKGMEVNSGLFRSGLLLRQCKAYRCTRESVRVRTCVSPHESFMQARAIIDAIITAVVYSTSLDRVSLAFAQAGLGACAHLCPCGAADVPA